MTAAVFQSAPVRFTFASVWGITMTLAMFLGLWRLVEQPFVATAQPTATEITFLPMRPEPIIESTRTPKPVPKPPQGGVVLPRGVPGDTGHVAPTVPPAGGVDFDGRERGGSQWGVDGDVVPLVTVPPEYPLSLVARGTQGWVIVEFTVGPNGAVRDPVVIDSQPRQVFDAAAVNAILRWRYQPKVEAGIAVERPGMRRKFTFRFDG